MNIINLGNHPDIFILSFLLALRLVCRMYFIQLDIGHTLKDHAIIQLLQNTQVAMRLEKFPKNMLMKRTALKR